MPAQSATISSPDINAKEMSVEFSANSNVDCSADASGAFTCKYREPVVYYATVSIVDDGQATTPAPTPVPVPTTPNHR